MSDADGTIAWRRFSPRAGLPMLEPGDIHLVCAELGAPGEDAAPLAPILSPAEAAKAERFCLAADRERFIAGRTLIRQMIAMATGAPAAAIEITTDARGKPFAPAHPGLSFNLSHSGSRLLAGLAARDTASAGHGIGVDIEWMRPLPSPLPIAKRVFDAETFEAVRQCEPGRRLGAFYRHWVLLEARLKALGAGLAADLSPAARVRLNGCGAGFVSLGPDYAAAWAALGPTRRPIGWLHACRVA